jgi:hypothetical protein
MMDKETVFKFLDDLRYKESDAYIKRELLMIEFKVSESRANELIEEYRLDIPNRRQFLTEGTNDFE